MSDFVAELKVVCWSVRQQLAVHDDLHALPNLLPAVRWPRLLWLAQQHGVLLSLSGDVQLPESGLVPADIVRQLAAQRAANHVNCLSRGRELCLLQDLFDRERIRAVSIAGWTLAQRHFRPPAGRLVGSNTAYLIDPLDRPRAESALAAAGYDLTDDPLRLGEFQRSRVVLQSLPASSSHPGDHAAIEAWRAAEPFSFGGRTLLILRPADWLIDLCARGTHHLWTRVRPAADVVALVAQHPDLEWAMAFERARLRRLERAVLLGLAVSHRLLDISLPAPVAFRLKQFPNLADSADALVADVARGVTTSRGFLARARTRLALQRDFSGKVRSAWSLLRAVRARRPTPLQLEGSDSASIGRYAPTPPAVVAAMLRLADTTANDLVCDLGCGDGRIVIAAAADFGARGLGVDLDPQCLSEATQAAADQGVAGRVRLVCGDALQTDLAGVTVVCLYLQGFGYDALRRKLTRELPRGTRIVSHNYPFPDWAPEKAELVPVSPSRVAPVYLWRIG